MREGDETKKGSYWWKKCVFYEVYVDKFAGTFENFTKKLGYLAGLGIDCIHVLPHYPSPMLDDGYDVSDFVNVRESLGTLDDFENFVKAAHENGIKVMLDLVLNHVSIEHPWFKEARSSTDNPRRNFFLWSKTGKELALVPVILPDIKPSNWIYNPDTDDYYFSSYYKEQVDLNWDNQEVFKEMMQVFDFWTAMGVDAFRIDYAAHLIKKDGSPSISLPETHALLKKIRSHLDHEHPNVALLAEGSGRNPVPVLKEYFGTGDECNLIYHFPLVRQLFLAIKRGDPSLIAKIVEESQGIPENCAWAIFLRHHDDLSLAAFPEDDRKELLEYFDPGAKYRYRTGISLRLGTMLHKDPKAILDAYRLLLSAPGSPIIYYGDEIGMENIPLATGEKDTRKSLRGKFDWGKAEKAVNDQESLFNKLSALIREWKRKAG